MNEWMNYCITNGQISSDNVGSLQKRTNTIYTKKYKPQNKDLNKMQIQNSNTKQNQQHNHNTIIQLQINNTNA